MGLIVNPSDDSFRRLLLAKALYQAALSSSSAPLRSHRRIIAVVNLDLANETLLKAVAWDLADGAQPKREFGALLAQARAAVAKAAGLNPAQPPPLPAERGAVEVHDLRNGAQHRARAPSDDDTSAARTHTRDFLLAVMERVWGADFDALAHSDAIDELTCRARMAEAEAALQRGEYLDAARHARSAMERAARLATERSRFPVWSRYQFSATDGQGTLASISRDIEREFDDVRREIHNLSLGFDPANQRRLTGLTGGYWVSLAGEQWDDPRDAIDKEAAEWVLAYCTESIVRIEDRFGSLVEDR